MEVTLEAMILPGAIMALTETMGPVEGTMVLMATMAPTGEITDQAETKASLGKMVQMISAVFGISSDR